MQYKKILLFGIMMIVIVSSVDAQIIKTLNVTFLDSMNASSNPCSLDGATQMARKLDAGYAYVSSLVDDTLTILDISDPYDIGCVGNKTLAAGVGSLDGAAGIKMDWERIIVYVTATVDDTFSYYNVTNRANPVLISGAPNPSSTPPATSDGALDIAPFRMGNDYWVAVAASTDDYITVWNVTNTASTPVFLAGYTTGTSAVCSTDDIRAMEWDKTRQVLITASYADDTIATWNMSTILTTGNITCLGYKTNAAAAYSLDGVTGFEYDNETMLLYVAASIDDTLTILNLSNLSSFGNVGYIASSTVYNLIDDCTVGDVKGDQSFAFCAIKDTTAGANNGIAIFNVTNPASPSFIMKLTEANITDGSSCQLNLTDYVEEHNGILYALSSGDDCFYTFKVYDYYEPPPLAYRITDFPENVTFLRLNDSLDLTQNGVAGIVPVIVKVDGIDAAIIVFNFSEDINAGVLETGVSREEGKSFIHNHSLISGVVNVSLLIPRINFDRSIIICPEAVSLEEVYYDCSGMIIINIGETVDGMTVSNITINELEYYVLSNVTGTGGVEGYPSGWSKCFNVTINNPTVSVLNDFPVNLNITYLASMQSDFDDLRFYSGGCGGTGSILFAELESKTDSTNAYIWVKTNLTTGNNTISVYYGNSTVSNNWDYAGNVWDSSFAGVWLMNQTTDSTVNNNDGGADVGTITRNQTFWGGSLQTAGGDANYFTVADSTSLYTPTATTFSTWVKMPTKARISYVVKYAASAGQREHWFEMADIYGTDTATLRFALGDVAGTTYYETVIPNSTMTDIFGWNNIVSVWNKSVDSGKLKMYVNGVEAASYIAQGTKTDDMCNSTNVMYFFRSYVTGRQFIGDMDEFTISNVDRSANWINMSYQLKANHASFVTYGSEETPPTDSCTCPSPVANWVINMTHHCNITINCNITGYNLTLTGGGSDDYVLFNSTVTFNHLFRNMTGIGKIGSIAILLGGKN